MQIPLLCRQLPSLFTTYWDRVRDHLNTIDPISFPCFGQSPISASDIFVRMCRFEGDRHLVSLKSTCNDESHRSRTKGYNATFVLVVPPAEHSFTERPTLQLWVSSYFRETRADSPLCRSCHMPHCSSLLVTPLSWIWIDIPPVGKTTEHP